MKKWLYFCDMGRKMGIYSIRCLIDNKVYVGSSRYVSNRLATHKSRLNAGVHNNRYLQNAYNKYGMELFQFGLLEEVVSEDALLEREVYWMDLLQSRNQEKGFNFQDPFDRRTCEERGLNKKKSPFCEGKVGRGQRSIICIDEETGEISEFSCVAEVVSRNQDYSYKKIADVLSYWKGLSGHKVTYKGKVYMDKDLYEQGKYLTKEQRNRRNALERSEEVFYVSVDTRDFTKYASLRVMSEKTGISQNTLYSRLKNGTEFESRIILTKEDYFSKISLEDIPSLPIFELQNSL